MIFALNGRHDDAIISAMIFAAVVFAVLYRRRARARGSFGNASFATDGLLRAWGMLGARGLVLARTLGGALIRLPRYCHLLLIGGSGSGKGIGLIIPNLLTYYLGSLVVFDPKGDLYATTAGRRERQGQRIVRLAPFDPGGDAWNPLDTIAPGPLLVDDAGAMAESLVVQSPGEKDPHWNQKAAQVIKAILAYVLLEFEGAERSLNSVQDIASDPKLLHYAGGILQGMGGIPGRLGSQIRARFEKPGVLTKEGEGVMSTVSRHLGFLDSEMVAASVRESTWDVRDLLSPGTTLYLTIPPSQLEAQKGLLRCWVSTLIRVIGAAGSEGDGEVLCLLDEASALGGLSAVEEALVRGRSAGVRLFLAYQSESQVEAAFPDKKTLIQDNCGVHIHMGPAGTFEEADRRSKALGDWTQQVASHGENDGWSRASGGEGGGGGSISGGTSENLAPQAHPLMRPSEILTMGEEYLIASVRGMPSPILARRVEWFRDPDFNPSVPRPSRKGAAWLVVIAVLCALALFAKAWGGK